MGLRGNLRALAGICEFRLKLNGSLIPEMSAHLNLVLDAKQCNGVLHGWLIEQGIFIIIISAFLLGVKANLFCVVGL